MDWHRKERYRSQEQEAVEAESLEIPDVESEDKQSVESTEAAAWLSAEMWERKERQAEKDAENIVRIREELEALSETEDEDVSAETPVPERITPHEMKVDAMERALGVPIDKEKAKKVFENSKTLDPVRYFLRAREYTGSLVKAFKMTFTTGGFRDPDKDAVFTNRFNNLAPEETKLHETMHVVSEREDAERGVDVFGAERTVSGIESVDDEGTIRLTSFNEGLTQYFTLRSREEMKMRGPKALGAYVREVGIVGDIVKILDGAGMDGNKVMAESFVAGNAEGIRDALDEVGGPGTFDTLASSMDEGAHKEVRRLLSTFDDESISTRTEAANDDVEVDADDDVRKKAA